MVHNRTGSLCLHIFLLITLFIPACSSTPTTVPTRTVPAEPSAANGWQRYVDTQHNLHFSYPATWQEQAPGHFVGQDGFARIEILTAYGASPNAICQVAANRKPRQYGDVPQITTLDDLHPPADHCLILPSADQPAGQQGKALFLWWNPAEVAAQPVVALYADREHILEIAKTLQPGSSVESTALPTAANCDLPPDSSPPNEYTANGLRITEFPLTQTPDCSPLRNPQAANQIVAEGPAAGRIAQVIAGQRSPARLNRLNTPLAPFGFHVQTSEEFFSIRKDGELLRSKLNWVGPLSVNASGSDFILPMLDSYNSQIYLARPDGLHPIEDWDILTYDRVFPVYVGDDRISLSYDYQRYPRPINAPALLDVKQNDTLIATFSVSGSSSAGGSARRLWSWNGHWILELLGVVIQDGEILNDTLGYSEMFAWQLFNNQPFYFFRKAGQIQASYHDTILPVIYDEVIYQPQSGMHVLLQMKSYDSGLLFYARRGSTWYYVAVSAGT